MGDKIDLDAIAEDLTPVRPSSPVVAWAAAITLTLAGGVFVIATLGFRDAFGASATDPAFLVRTAILVMLALFALRSATAMARPEIGASHGELRWVAAIAGLVPIAAIIAALASQIPVAERLYPANGMECLTWSIGIGVVLGALLTWWLRRGAPVSPKRAGIVTGLAAGSLGALAYSMHCPHNDIVYIGLWYTLAIAATTLLGRLIVPHFIRW